MKVSSSSKLANSILVTILLSSLLLVSLTSSVGVYDPWLDTNDDGKIDMRDISNLARMFGGEGTPINKTELILELQSRVAALETELAILQADYSIMNTTIEALEDKVNSLMTPYNATWENDQQRVTLPFSQWATIPNMTVVISLDRTSFLQIAFSGRFASDIYIGIQAIVDSSTAYPGSIRLRPLGDRMAITFNFVFPTVSVGKHLIEIQWRREDTAEGPIDIFERLLTVTALPS